VAALSGEFRDDERDATEQIPAYTSFKSASKRRAEGNCGPSLIESAASPMRLIRVFPRKTKATPTDPLTYFGPPDRHAEADEIHVSVTFSFDKDWAEYLAEQWRHVAPVKIGGVAYGDRGDEFVPGKYIKPGYVFTSRGCPRRRQAQPAWPSRQLHRSQARWLCSVPASTH
jgi:hypothetical protein